MSQQATNSSTFHFKLSLAMYTMYFCSNYNFTIRYFIESLMINKFLTKMMHNMSASYKLLNILIWILLCCKILSESWLDPSIRHLWFFFRTFLQQTKDIIFTFLSHCWWRYLNKIVVFSVTITGNNTLTLTFYSYFNQ